MEARPLSQRQLIAHQKASTDFSMAPSCSPSESLLVGLSQPRPLNPEPGIGGGLHLPDTYLVLDALSDHLPPVRPLDVPGVHVEEPNVPGDIRPAVRPRDDLRKVVTHPPHRRVEVASRL